MPYTFEAPVLELAAVIPPTLLLLAVHALLPKLNIPITSLAEEEEEVYVILPVADMFPTVFPVTSPIVVRPDATYMPLNKDELLVPEAAPEIAIPATVFPCTLVAGVVFTDRLI